VPLEAPLVGPNAGSWAVLVAGLGPPDAVSAVPAVPPRPAVSAVSVMAVVAAVGVVAAVPRVAAVPGVAAAWAVPAVDGAGVGGAGVDGAGSALTACSVQELPSHQRHWPADAGSAYHPGSRCLATELRYAFPETTWWL
jgi:hypothetical protein